MGLRQQFLLWFRFILNCLNIILFGCNSLSYIMIHCHVHCDTSIMVIVFFMHISLYSSLWSLAFSIDHNNHKSWHTHSSLFLYFNLLIHGCEIRSQLVINKILTVILPSRYWWVIWGWRGWPVIHRWSDRKWQKEPRNSSISWWPVWIHEWQTWLPAYRHASWRGRGWHHRADVTRGL